jgi:hypothetical protein
MRLSVAWLICCLPCTGAPLQAAVENIYLDSSNAQSGDGSMQNPYSRLAQINWSSVSTRVAGGAEVIINLKRGSTFRETLTVGASGTASAPLVVRDYGDGELPVIRGDSVLKDWVSHPAGAGQTWSVPWTGPVFYIWAGGTVVSKGQSAESLKEKEFFPAGNRIYFRCDAGNPDAVDLKVTISARNNAVSLSGRSFVRLEHLCLRNTSSFLARLATGDAIALRNCQLLQAGGQLELNAVTNAQVNSCIMEDSHGPSMISVSGPATTAALRFCHLHNAGGGNGIQVSACQTLNLINCNLIGVRGRGIDNASSGTIDIRNCLFSSIGNSNAVIGNETIANAAAGNCRAGNSLILPNGRSPALHMSGVADLGGNIYRAPGFNRTRREGLWVIMEDDYGSMSDWSALARLASSGYGYRTTLALNDTDRIHLQYRQLLQQLINEGHDIVSHTRSHANLSRPESFRIRYVGSGADCTLTIANNRLTTTVNGAAADENLSIDLTVPAVDRVEELIPYIDRLAAYECSYIDGRTAYNHAVPSRLLQEVSNIDIKSAAHSAAFNKGQFFANEIQQSKSDLETVFKDGSDAPYQCKYLIYPGGYYNDEVINETIAAGYLGGRMDSPIGGGGQLDSFDIYLTQVAVGINGNMLNVLFENKAADDYSLSQNHFSVNNVAFSTRAYRLTYAGEFNGSNAFLSRPVNPSFDFSKGDWHLSARLWPDRMDGNHTVFSMGSDTGNFFKVYLDDHGALRLSLVSGGAETLSLATPQGAVNMNGWQKISIQQLFDRWMIRINDELVLDKTNKARLKPYAGPVYIGCRHDYGGDSNDDFYAGLMDDFVMSNGTYYKTQAAADLICETGALLNSMSHGETGTPREVWRIVMDALHDYSGSLRVMTYTGASDYIRANGVLQADNRTVVRKWNREPNYNLRADSPCIGAGANDVIEGMPGLTDANEVPVTDAEGKIIVAGGKLSIGAFQPQLQVVSSELSEARRGDLYFVSLQAIGGVGVYEWMLAPNSLPLPAGLTLSADGILSGKPETIGGFVFTVQVKDATGLIVERTVQLHVRMPSDPQIVSVGFTPQHSCRLSITSEVDGILSLESSTNIQDWAPAGTVQITNGTGTWEDPVVEGAQRWFYRIRF